MMKTEPHFMKVHFRSFSKRSPSFFSLGLLSLLTFALTVTSPVLAEPSSSPSSDKTVQTKSKTTKRKSVTKKKGSFINKKSKRTTPRRKRRRSFIKRTQLAKTGKSEKAILDSKKNKVSIKRKGDANWQTAKRKMKLSVSDKIKTGRRSIARIKLQDGTKILLLQNSQAELQEMSSIQRTIKLFRGKIRAIVRRIKNRAALKIQTPIGVASVRGTEFEVEYEEDNQEMSVYVIRGQVSVTKLGDLAEEVILNPGQSIKFGIEGIIGDPVQTGAIPFNRTDVRTEIQITKVKDSILAQAAIESRDADFQVGKSIIDVDGTRVRVEEYIIRPKPDQFKLVVLNERPSRFDYFTYLGDFNKDLPTDLKTALSQLNGQLTTQPEYYLESYESVSSNTKDHVRDIGSGGHLVRIDFDGTNYTLFEVGNESGNKRTIEAAVLQNDGSYKVYNPLKDTFSLVTAANVDAAKSVAVLEAGRYRNFGSGDSYFKGRFNSNTFSINNVVKTAFAQKTTANTLAIDLDATFTNAPITTISEFPSGTGILHNRLSLFYADGTKVVYDNYIIDDEGNVAEASRFDGLTTSAAYQSELLNWNYQQNVTSDEMEGRSIRLIVAPEIGTLSGLIQ